MLAVQFTPNDPNTYIACDTKDHVLLFDVRQPQAAMAVTNDCMVYSVDVEYGGKYFVTGDQKGLRPRPRLRPGLLCSGI